MTEAERLFRETEIERKRLGYGDKHKKRGGGRYVRLPSDRLSKKEREALNGECKTFKKKDFYTWDEFKELPSDLKVAWVNSIINRYGAGVETISEIVFGCSKKNRRNHLTRIGEMQFVNKPLTGKAGQNAKKALAAAVALWKTTQITMSEEDLPQDDPDPAAAEKPKPFVKIDPLELFGIVQPENEPISSESEALSESPAPATDDFIMPPPPVHLKPGDLSNLGILIQSLIGSGAKLTIEVTL